MEVLKSIDTSPQLRYSALAPCHTTGFAHHGASGTVGGGGFVRRELLAGRRRLRTKREAVQSGTRHRMRTIRADFNTHRDHRWDALIVLPVVRKLLLEIRQEVG